jgi:integrase
VSGHIRQRGKQSWRLKFDDGRSPDGRRLTRYITFRGSKREAERELTRLLARRNEGTYVDPSNLTVADHIRSRIEQWSALGKITPKTAERYHELLANQIAPHIGKAPLQKLKPADIERWHATLKKRGRKDGDGGLSAQTIRHAHRLLSKALKEAVRHDIVMRNVAAIEPPPPTDNGEVVVLDPEQIKLLVERLRRRTIYPKVITALFTGIRRGELLALRWSDLVGRTLRVGRAIEETRGGLRIKTPKTENSVREISLPDIVISALHELRERQAALGLEDEGLIFPKLDGTAQSPRAFSKEWAVVAASLGLPVTFHALRHTHASHLIDAGIDVVKISRRLGHATPAITLRVYAHLFRKRDDKSGEAINAAVVEILGANSGANSQVEDGTVGAK